MMDDVPMFDAPPDAAPADAPPPSARRSDGTFGTGRRKQGGARKVTPRQAKAKARADRPPKPPGRPSKDAQLVARLDDLFVGLGALITAADPFDGQVLITGGPALADALGDVAAANPRVARALDRFLSSAGWGGVVIAGASIAVPICAHHRVLPAHLQAFGAGADHVQAVDVLPDDVTAAAAAAGIDLAGMGLSDLADLASRLGTQAPGATAGV